MGADSSPIYPPSYSGEALGGILEPERPTYSPSGVTAWYTWDGDISGSQVGDPSPSLHLLLPGGQRTYTRGNIFYPTDPESHIPTSDHKQLREDPFTACRWHQQGSVRSSHLRTKLIKIAQQVLWKPYCIWNHSLQNGSVYAYKIQRGTLTTNIKYFILNVYNFHVKSVQNKEK